MKLFDQFLSICSELKHYPTESELIYKYGFSKVAVKEINEFKIKHKDFIKLSLTSEKNIPLVYFNDPKFTTDFLGSEDLIRNSSMNKYTDYRNSEIINDFIFLEIESSLAIEGVRSTRAHIENINDTNYDDLLEINDIIIKNMLLGYDYVKKNDITEENIYELYNIISRKSLKESERLLPNNFYCHDDVNIVNSAEIVVDRGVDHVLIPKLMKSI